MALQQSHLRHIARKGINQSHLLRFGSQSGLRHIAHVRGLINLTRLEFQDTAVSDISPIAGLINLIVLKIDDTDVTDLYKSAGLINLKELHDDPEL